MFLYCKLLRRHHEHPPIRRQKCPGIGLAVRQQYRHMLLLPGQLCLGQHGGYRLIDTARYYGNEEGVGAGVRRAVAEGIVMSFFTFFAEEF